MGEQDAGWSCLECGRAVRRPAGLVCGKRCNAVMTLVRYGRRHRDEDGGLDPERMAPLRRRGRVVGAFPTDDARVEALARARRRCEVAGCRAPAELTDFRSDDPDLQTIAVADIRAVCAEHHRAESLRRFVGADGQTARSAPAIWARIWSERPLVPRDDEGLWRPGSTRLLTSAPPAAEASAEDSRRVSELLRLAPVDGDDLDAAFEWAFDQLGWTQARRGRFVRALKARMVTFLASGTATSLFGLPDDAG